MLKAIGEKIILVFEVILMGIIVYSVFNISLVVYGVDQLFGQLNIVVHARPIEDILKMDTLDSKSRSKLLLVEEVKEFAIDTLGLKGNENYATFYNQQNKPLLWVFTACEEFSLRPYEWYPFSWFSIV